MLPAFPTVLVALSCVIAAFVIGRVTGGGDRIVARGPVTTTTTTTLAPVTHTVAEKETLAAIASRYGVSIDAIAEANNISDPSHIFVGQVLLIPPPAPEPTTTKKRNND